MAPRNSPFPLPFPLGAFSRAGDKWRERIVPFEVERFTAAARRITGLEDFADEGNFGARLDDAVASLNRVDLNLIGRFAARTMMHWHLINRLHIVDLLKKRPEIEETPIRAPIIVTGLFRTGTTFLHNVLAADPTSRAGRMWELSYPLGRPRDPLGDERWRQRRTSIPLTMNHVIVPDQDVVHYVHADGYEEDFFLLGSDMALMTQIVGLGDWDYAWRLLERDMVEPFRWHRRQLQILSEQRSAERWLLKCPWHLWNLDALLQVYPDAKIIHTHRDVAKAIGSHCSLGARIVCRMQRDLNIGDLSRFWVDYSREGLARGQRVKDRLPPTQVYDVLLRDLRTAPGETIRAIYEQLELPCDDALVARFDQVAASDPTFQHGVHEYRIEDFGLDAGEVRDAFAEYRERFSLK